MDVAKRREIASMGGKAAHQKGTAHEWTSEEAREAGRRGGLAGRRRRATAGETQPPAIAALSPLPNLAEYDGLPWRVR